MIVATPRVASSDMSSRKMPHPPGCIHTERLDWMSPCEREWESAVGGSSLTHCSPTCTQSAARSHAHYHFAVSLPIVHKYVYKQGCSNGNCVCSLVCCFCFSVIPNIAEISNQAPISPEQSKLMSIHTVAFQGFWLLCCVKKLLARKIWICGTNPLLGVWIRLSHSWVLLWTRLGTQKWVFASHDTNLSSPVQKPTCVGWKFISKSRFSIHTTRIASVKLVELRKGGDCSLNIWEYQTWWWSMLRKWRATWTKLWELCKNCTYQSCKRISKSKLLGCNVVPQ